MSASLADLKQHLNITSAASDDELQLMLDAAEDLVRSLVGDQALGSVTESVSVVGGTAILSRRPTGTVLVSGVPIGGAVNAAAGLVTGLGSYYSGSLTVTYPVDSVQPASVLLATLIIAAHLWETQRGTSPSALALQGDVDPSAFAGGSGFAIPNRARELLAPYVRSSSIA